MVYGRLFGRSSNWTVHRQFGVRFTRTSLNRPFGHPCTIDLNASKYTNMYCPFGQNLAVRMGALTPCFWTIQIYVCGRSIWTTLERIIRLSKYTLTDCPNGQSVWWRPCYVHLDRPNGQWSNGPFILRKFEPSIGTKVQLTTYITLIWTVQMEKGLTDLSYFVNLHRPNGQWSIGPPILC